MKKRIIVSSAIGLFLLIGCSTEPIIEKNYIFTFNFDDGEKISTSVGQNQLLTYTLPSPSKEGYTFNGWYCDEELTKQFDISYFDENDSVNLFPSWKINEYSIALLSEDSEVLTYTFNYKDKINLVVDTELYDYSFYLDESFTKPLDLSHMPAYDFNVYLKTTVKTVSYSFNTCSDVIVNPVIIARSMINEFELPDLVREGYSFDGWYVDSQFTIPYTASYFDNSDSVNLNAKWIINVHNVNLHTNDGLIKYQFCYGDIIDIPPIQSFEHDFISYYLDDTFNQRFDCYLMPDYDIDLYPCFCEHNWKYNSNSVIKEMYCVECGYHTFPIIEIKTASLELTKEYSDCFVNVNSGNQTYDMSDVACSIKVRGNGSATYPKKPYRLKFNSKQIMLGLNDNLSAKSWVLLAEYHGYSIKDLIAMDIAKSIYHGDYYSTDYSFVKLYLNNEYEGIYLLAEQQQINKGRINVPEATIDSGVLTGYLVELDYYAEEEEYYFEIDYKHDLIFANGEPLDKDNAVSTYTIKSDIYTNEQQLFIQKVFQNTYDVLYDSLWTDHSDLVLNPYKTLDSNFDIIQDPLLTSPKEAVSKVIDYDSLIRMFLIQEITENYDVGYSSFYFAFDGSSPNPKIVFNAPWDFDFSLLNVNTTPEYPYLLSKNSTWHQYYNFWFMLFSNSDWFLEDLAHYYMDNEIELLVNNTINKVNSFIDVYIDELYDNYCRWPDILAVDERYYVNFVRYYNIMTSNVLNSLRRKLNDLSIYFSNHITTGYNVSFINETNATVVVYYDESLTELAPNNPYVLNDMSGDGQVYFEVLLDPSYEIESISIDGTYKNLKTLSVLGHDNAYKITKVGSNLSVTINTTLGE